MVKTDAILGVDPLSGISGLLRAKPESGRVLTLLAQTILRDMSGALSAYERELIATSVSFKNGCLYCTMSHRAAAAHVLEGCYNEVDQCLSFTATEPSSLRIKTLLAVAHHVQSGVKALPQSLRAQAHEHGIDDHQIHDAVLVASAFTMFNRYVETLNPYRVDASLSFEASATQKVGPVFENFDLMGRRLAKAGYV